MDELTPLAVFPALDRPLAFIGRCGRGSSLPVAGHVRSILDEMEPS
jgi:hypothetical protein